MVLTRANRGVTPNQTQANNNNNKQPTLEPTRKEKEERKNPFLKRSKKKEEHQKQMTGGEDERKSIGGEAIPLIEVNPATNEYKVNPKAIEFLKTLSGILGVIAVAGKYRTGKSYLLNNCVLRAGEGEGFGVGATTESCTKGVWIYTKTITCYDEDGQPFDAIVLDTEGIGSMDASSTHDSRIFSLALLLSSYFIYNSQGAIDEAAINQLSLVCNISQHVRVQASQKEDSDAVTLGQYFPDFLWTLRDFTLKLRDRDGREISERQYLENCLADQRLADKDSEASKNQIREALRGYFPRRDCKSVVRPLLDESKLQMLEFMDDGELRKEFVTDMNILRKKITTKTRPKTAMGKPINGYLFAHLCEAYAEAFNSGAAPAIKDSWTMLCEVQSREAIDMAVRDWEGQVRALLTKRDAVSPEKFLGDLDDIERAAVATFEATSLSSGGSSSSAESREFAAKLGEALADRKRDAVENNEHRIEKYMGERIQELDGKFSSFESFEEFHACFQETYARAVERVGESPMTRSLWSGLTMDRVWTWAQNFFRVKSTLYERAAEDIERVRGELERAQERYHEVKESHLAELRERDQQVGDLERQRAELREQHGEEEARLKTSIEELRARHEQELGEARRELEEATAKIESVQKQLLERDDTFTQELTEKDAELERIKLELDGCQSQIASLKDELEDAKNNSKELDARDAQIRELEHRREQLEKRVKDLTDENGNMRESEERSLGEFRDKLAKIEERAMGMVKEVKKTQEQERKSTQQRIQQLEADKKKAEHIVQTQLVQVKDKLAKTEKELEDCRVRGESEAARCAAEVEALRGEVGDKARELRESQERYEAAIQKLKDEHAEEVKARKAKETEMYDARIAEQQESTRRIREAETRAKMSEVEITSLKRRLDDTEERLSKRIKMEDEVGNQKTAKLESEVGFLRKDKVSLEETLEQERARRKQLEKQKADLDRSVESRVMEAKFDLNQQITLLEREISQLKSKERL